MQTPNGASGRPGIPSQRAALIGTRYGGFHCLASAMLQRRLMYPCARPALKPALQTLGMIIETPAVLEGAQRTR